MIPRRLIRSVPATTSGHVEGLWDRVAQLHPGWELVTYRDPIDPADFPRTSPHWHRCSNGAQLAGLVRLEALWNGGGIWLDSDIRVVRNLEPLLTLSAFACWEDRSIVPDAVIGAEPGHPAIDACLTLAIERLTGTGRHWTNDQGAWSTGPGVTTTILPGRPDVVCLPPDVFFPVHYAPRDTLPERLAHFDPPPWCYGIHEWAWSWR